MFITYCGLRLRERKCVFEKMGHVKGSKSYFERYLKRCSLLEKKNKILFHYRSFPMDKWSAILSDKKDDWPYERFNDRYINIYFEAIEISTTANGALNVRFIFVYLTSFNWRLTTIAWSCGCTKQGAIFCTSCLYN